MSEKYAFIAAERAEGEAVVPATDAPTMMQMCSWLGVSTSGFYEWRERGPSATEQRRELLTVKIAALCESFGGVYGDRRLHAELVRAGERVGPELVRTLMPDLGLVPVQPRPYRTTTGLGEHRYSGWR